MGLRERDCQHDAEEIRTGREGTGGVQFPVDSVVVAIGKPGPGCGRMGLLPGRMLHDRKGCDVLSLDVIDKIRPACHFRGSTGKVCRWIPAATTSFCCLRSSPCRGRRTAFARGRPRAARSGTAAGCGRLRGTLWDRILTRGISCVAVADRENERAMESSGPEPMAEAFREAGFHVREAVSLGHHLGRLCGRTMCCTSWRRVGADHHRRNSGSNRPMYPE